MYPVASDISKSLNQPIGGCEKMEIDDVKKILLEKSLNQKISCVQVFEIADSVGWPKKKLGDLLNEMGIKIGACQLGCFK